MVAHTECRDLYGGWIFALLCLLPSCVEVSDTPSNTRSWRAPERIDETPFGASAQVALDANGTAIVVWDVAQGGCFGDDVFARRHSRGETWSPIDQMDDDRDSAYIPEVAVDPSGNAVAVWTQGWCENARGVWSNRFEAGTGWSTPEQVDDPSAGDAGLFVQVAVDREGNAIAVWHQFGERTTSVWANRSTPGDGWGEPEQIETNDLDYSRDPRIAMDTNGNAIAVWYESDGTRENVWANRYERDRDGWGSPKLLESRNAGSANFPQVAMDPEGNAVAVWRQSDGTRFSVWANRYRLGDKWGEAELIEHNDEGHAAEPSVGLDGSGNAIAVWSQFDGALENIWANRFRPGQGWGEPELIEQNDEGNALHPKLAVAANGEAVVVWEQWDGLRNYVWASAYRPGHGWDSAQRVDTHNEIDGNILRPQVAIDPDGNAMAAWDHTLIPVSQNIWTARFE